MGLMATGSFKVLIVNYNQLKVSDTEMCFQWNVLVVDDLAGESASVSAGSKSEGSSLNALSLTGGNHEGAEAAEGASGPGLSSHLSHHHREALLVDPEMVVERSHMSGDFFNLYLHQNYLDFFSEVEDVDRASEYLSDADLLTADWTSRTTMGDYGSSVATRGLLHSNSQQVSVGFRPLHKPNWLLISKKHQENCLAAQCLFRSFCLTPVSLQTELLPYLAKLTNPMRNQAQIAFIQDVGQMPLRRFSTRLKLEALTDKEPGQLEPDSEEEEEEKEEGQEGLPASQPPPTANQVMLEEEDLIIEEYNSD